jgi:catechol 2,3-dioxygenase-like lactoylglutathione lyase family enzyme
MTEVHGLSRIGQIAMAARDLDRAVAFYRDPYSSFVSCHEVMRALAS